MASVSKLLTGSGLTNGATYSCTVFGTNTAGIGPTSAPSNSVTPTGATTATLSSLSIAGGASTLAAGSSVTLTATASFSNGTSRSVSASWSSSSAAASVSSSGTLTGNTVSADTPVTITASYTEGSATRTATLNLTVTAGTGPRLQSLSIQGASTVQEGATVTLRAIAFFSDGSSKSVSPNWTSSNPSVASVGVGGALIAGAVTATTPVSLTASYTEGGVSVNSSFALTVQDVLAAPNYLTVTGASSVQRGQSATLAATASYTDGSTRSVAPAWTSSNASVATVSAAGAVTCVTAQASTDASVLITATYTEGSVSKTALFNLVCRSVVLAAVTPSLSAGYSHSIALRKDGTVWSWGWSFLGQAGSGEAKTRSTPIQVSGLTAVTAIAAGAAHNLALKADGTVWAWGHNGQGGLGNGSTNDSYTAVNVSGITGARAVAAGIFHSLALKSDGTVLAWGANAQGQLGDGTNAPVRLTPTPVGGLTGVTAIAASLNHSQALKSDGTVWVWGDLGVGGSSTTPVPFGQLSGVSALAAGWEHVLALKADGTVWAWGRNAQGQLGDGTQQDRATPAPVAGLSNVRAIAAGFNHSVAIKNDGTVWTWGGNAQGQHGNGGTDPQYTPAPVPGMNNAIALAAGNDYTIVLKGDGYVWGAGHNWLGQLGDGSFVRSNRFAPVQDADTTSFFDLAPDLAKNPVSSDQVPKFFMQSEKSGDEALSALGNLSSLILSSRIRRNGGSFAADANYQLFVAILAPNGKPGLTASGIPSVPVNADTLFFKTSAGSWLVYAGGALPAYLSNVAASQVDANVLNILAGTDLSGMSGAQFYVGYGTSADEMMAAARYRILYEVP